MYFQREYEANYDIRQIASASFPPPATNICPFLCVAIPGPLPLPLKNSGSTNVSTPLLVTQHLLHVCLPDWLFLEPSCYQPSPNSILITLGKQAAKGRLGTWHQS